VKLAELPDAVRGYGAVKERYLAHAQEQKARLLDQWRNGGQRLQGEAQIVRIHAAQL
jgi:indolepyruvate ferredoxin oxidoreductase